MFKLFIEGGAAFMSVLTILLIAVFFAAWKAPRWVKEIGIAALAVGVLSFLLGMSNVLDALAQIGRQTEQVNGVFDLISPGVLYGGLKVGLIPVIYGVIIYIVSLVVIIILKPRL